MEKLPIIKKNYHKCKSKNDVEKEIRFYIISLICAQFPSLFLLVRFQLSCTMC